MKMRSELKVDEELKKQLKDILDTIDKKYEPKTCLSCNREAAPNNDFCPICLHLEGVDYDNRYIDMPTDYGNIDNDGDDKGDWVGEVPEENHIATKPSDL